MQSRLSDNDVIRLEDRLSAKATMRLLITMIVGKGEELIRRVGNRLTDSLIADSSSDRVNSPCIDVISMDSRGIHG